jgi:hypothetical protein
MKIVFPRLAAARPVHGGEPCRRPRAAGKVAAVVTGLLSAGAFLTMAATPSAAVTGGSCPVAYDQSIFVAVPLPAGSNGEIQGQIGVDCSSGGYTEAQVTGPSHGTISWSGALNEGYAYSPASGYTGRDSVQYCQVLASDPQGGCQSQIGTLSFFMGHANNDSYTTPSGTTLFVGCAGCAGDPLTNDQPFWYALANVSSLPSHGTLTWQQGNWSPASFAYKPDPGFTGKDSFTYCMSFDSAVTDCPATFSGSSNGVMGIADSASSNIATVTITVTAPKPTVSLLVPPTPFTLLNPTTLAWTGADYSGGPGLAYYQVRTKRARWNGGFGPWSAGPHLSPGSTAVHPALATGFGYCFEVRAADKAGLTSAWTAPDCMSRPLDDASLAASSGWTRKTSSLYYQGTYSVTKHQGATLTLAGAKLDRVAVIATRCPGCGQIGVYAGTSLIGKITLAGSPARHQWIFALPAFAPEGTKITIKVLSTGKTVEIDGLGVSRT